MADNDVLELLALVTSLGRTDAQLDDQLHTVCRLVAHGFQMDACAIRQICDGEPKMRAMYGMEAPPALCEKCAAVVQQVLSTQQPFALVTDHHPQIRAFSGAPLIADGVCIGTLGLYSFSSPKLLNESELMHLQIVANHVAVVISNGRLTQELQELHQNLKYREQRQTRDLVNARDGITEFAYSITHDMRAPLRSIVKTSEELIQGGETLGIRNDLYNKQKESAIRLASRLDDLLNWIRLAQAEPKYRSVNVSELCEQVSRQVGISAEIEPDLWTMCDPKLLRFALFQLFDNSKKFQSPQKPLVVRVSYDQPDERFLVSDNGIGFEMSHTANMFRPFERLVSEDDYPGSGIGLATVKRIIDAHHGNISIRSIPHHGTTVAFSLGASVSKEGCSLDNVSMS